MSVIVLHTSECIDTVSVSREVWCSVKGVLDVFLCLKLICNGGRGMWLAGGTIIGG